MKRTVQVTLIAALLLPTAATAARFKAEPDQTKQAQYRSEERERTETRYKGEQREQPPRGAAGPPRTRVRSRRAPAGRGAPQLPIRRSPARRSPAQPAPVERHYITRGAHHLARVILQHRPYDTGPGRTRGLRKWRAWTDMVLDWNDRGHGLYLELRGPTPSTSPDRLANGTVRRWTSAADAPPGLYELTDSAPGAVEYCAGGRAIARACG